MHLKSLTLKGFKSFASATVLRFEPGISCVVGPNGSGKSNVVDAITWVLGEQGAKALRGGTMEDVIFAGTAGRPPLGRAEVTLTIDNADGALPIGCSEVSITRRVFRDGAGEYEINGVSCRLLDVQELLSDSGIGREMHVVVGQGQLDAILQAKPEERRAFVEEAAGVLKHRKRKEKALRKLDAMAANLNRLTDLTTELRRQLKPLGRQAEVARRAQTVQAEVRDAKLRLAADDLVTLRTQLARDEADEASARARRAEVETALARLRAEQSELETQLGEASPRLVRAQDAWYRLCAVQERLRGTLRLAAERGRHLRTQAGELRTGPDPDELERQAADAAQRESTLTAALTAARGAVSTASAQRVELERTLTNLERAHLSAVRAVADRREGLARLAGRVGALRSTATATAGEIDRMSDALAGAEHRAEAARVELDELQAQVAAMDADAVSLDERHEVAVDAHEHARKRVEGLVARERGAEQERAHWKARVEALSMSVTRRDGAATLLASGGRLPGVLGSVAALLTVDTGFETAVAAALGAAADAVAVASPDDAVAALRMLKDDDAGRVGLLIGGGPGAVPRSPELPQGARWALDLVRAPESLRPALGRALHDVVVVADLAAARTVVGSLPRLRAVTVDGDLLGGHWAAGGSAGSRSIIEVRAAADEARDRLAAAESGLERLRGVLDRARAEEAARLAEVENAQEELHASDARLAALAEQLGRLGQAARSAEAEADRFRNRRAAVEQARADALTGLTELEGRLATAEEEPLEDEPDLAERDAVAAALAVARTEEVDALLGLRSAEERARAVAGRSDALRREARVEREARQRAEAARDARARGVAVTEVVVRVGALALERITTSLARAAAEREAASAGRAEREAALEQVRRRTVGLGAGLERLTDAVHRNELLCAQQRLRVEQLQERIVEEFAVGVADLLADYGPDVPVPASPGELLEYEAARGRAVAATAPPPVPYDRGTQQRRAKRAERDLALLGRVNPLALEEFAALEERLRFLSTQLEDLKATRRDLLTVVREVDDKILEVFAAAFADVAREFEVVFRTLFPGGEGRLVLTDPDDLLSTGVEVEARPPGKKIKRLSLLSGGERSLAAVAMLVAIFRARPSPFYVLDEVEAALDDANLHRLIGLLAELRQSSQLIVITHQKPTMEIADVLYGVSMRGDGITTVVSQRLRPVPAGAPPDATGTPADRGGNLAKR